MHILLLMIMIILIINHLKYGRRSHFWPAPEGFLASVLGGLPPKAGEPLRAVLRPISLLTLHPTNIA